MIRIKLGMDMDTASLEIKTRAMMPFLDAVISRLLSDPQRLHGVFLGYSTFQYKLLTSLHGDGGATLPTTLAVVAPVPSLEALYSNYYPLVFIPHYSILPKAILLLVQWNSYLSCRNDIQ